MGCSKQLLRPADKPVICWCIDALRAAGLEDIIVVLGPTGGEIHDTIKGYSLEIVWNTDPESDMAGSVKACLKALSDKTNNVLILPVDHPLVSAQTIKTIVKTHLEYPECIIAPIHNGRKGHPVIFPRTIIEELYTLPTLRDIVRRDDRRVQLIEVDDEGILLNMNTPQDFREIEQKIAVRISTMEQV